MFQIYLNIDKISSNTKYNNLKQIGKFTITRKD